MEQKKLLGFVIILAAIGFALQAISLVMPWAYFGYSCGVPVGGGMERVSICPDFSNPVDGTLYIMLGMVGGALITLFSIIGALRENKKITTCLGLWFSMILIFPAIMPFMSTDVIGLGYIFYAISLGPFLVALLGPYRLSN